MSVLRRRTNSSGWWERQRRRSLQRAACTHVVPGGTRNAGARACQLSAVRQEVSRVERVLEEDRVGDIPRGRVAWRGSPGGWRGRRAPRVEVGWDRSLGTWWDHRRP